jgi:RNA polymerase sigma factor (sigma-70 family)
MARRLDQLDDSRLAARVRAGDEAAFEVLYDRHHRSLLSFCRHMLGNAEDGEDALQQTFLRAHGALGAGQLPETVRPWLFAIARNRCKTILATRRPAAVAVEDFEPSFDGLAEDVALRADLRELVADLGRLPEDQRAALVLFELGGMSQAEIAGAIGVPAGKVKALGFQARTELMAERDARSTPCSSIREELAVARGGALRRGPLRRHLNHCEPCQAYRMAVATQRAGFAQILPVAPALGLKAAVLAAATGKAGLEALSGGGVAGTAGGGAGSAASGGFGAGGGASGGGAGLAVVAKLSVAAVLVGGAALGGIAAVDRAAEPAGVNAAAAAIVVATPTPTATPTRTPAPTPTASPAPAPPDDGSGPRATATATAPLTEPAAPSATAAAAATASGAGQKPRLKRKRPRLKPVRGIVRERVPVTGEFSEPDPTPTPAPAGTAAPTTAPQRGRRRRRDPAPTATPTAVATATPAQTPRSPRRQPTATPTP